MKILVTGREGQVVRALVDAAGAEKHLDLSTIARPEADLAIPGSMAAVIRAKGADLVINAAAYTAVDAAESEQELAERINATGAGEVAEAAAAIGARLIHISTDYVFDGRNAPYREEDPTGPLNVYGRSKLAGERLVIEAHPDAWVARTGWVFSPWGRNFVQTMLRLAETREEIAVVDDQRGCPTSAIDLSQALLRLARRDPVGGGTLHLVGSGEASWAEMADTVMRASRENGGPSAAIRRISTLDYPTPARRPADTRLNIAAAEALDITMPGWRQSLISVVEALVRRR